MIHNGVEYGMMQAIAEGFGILSKTKYNFNLIISQILGKREVLFSVFE